MKLKFLAKTLEIYSTVIENTNIHLRRNIEFDFEDDYAKKLLKDFPRDFEIIRLDKEIIKEKVETQNAVVNNTEYKSIYTNKSNKLPVIIIPHHNRSDYLQLCLSNIPREYKVYVIRGGTFSHNCNKGFKLAMMCDNPEDVIFLNDDCIINKRVLDEINVLRVSADIVGIKAFLPDISYLFEKVGFDVELFKQGKYAFDARGARTPLDFPSGGFYLIKSKLFQEIGMYNEEYINGGEDVELFLKAIELKSVIKYTGRSVVHFHMQSEGRMDKARENHELILKNFPIERINAIMNPEKYPLVSIVIPHLKHRIKRLDETLKSISNQTYKNIEIIIEEDQERNASITRNKGAKKTKGKYLFFCDDDVALDENCISKMVDKLERSYSSFCYCKYKMSGEKIGIQQSQEFNVEDLYHRNYISTMSLIRRSDFIGFDEKLNQYQDWDLWLRMVERQKTGIFIPEVLFETFYDNDGITIRENAVQNRKIIKEKYYNKIARKKLWWY